MKAVDCPRAWEAEAMIDGRVDGAERASFERHASTCVSCRDELSALRSLDAAMRAFDVDAVPDLDRHRLRSSLLREANARVVSAGRSRIPAFVPIAMAFAVVAAAATAWIVHKKAPAIAVQSVATPPKFDVTTVDGAVWRSRTEGATATVELVDGSAAFAVPRLEATQRFIVALPDAEIEVRGTRFVVVVETGATRSVSVSEGRVVLRRRGADELALRAGDHWSKVDSAFPPDVVASAPAPKSSAIPHATRVPPIAASSPSVAANAPSAASEFADAMAAFGNTDYARAESMFARFAADFPADPRCEDASFLRAVARWRLGDHAGAATLAKAYLDAYPNGLRSVEARRMIDAPGAHN